jgi:MinD-like ATPase involved in chromosome partitioning or flagellar assembly
LKKEEGKIILISGSKGGCGQSFLSNCIANYLAINTDKNILMMDFNIGKMDSRIVFKAQEKNIRTIFDIKNMSGEVDESLIKKIVINFNNSFNVIFPPLYSDNLKAISSKNLLKIFKTLKGIFDVVLIDHPSVSNLKDNDSSIMDSIDKLLLVSLPDLISLSNLNIIINQIEGSIDYLNPAVIINKYNIRPSISFSLLNTILKYPVEYFVPFDRDIEQLYLEKGPAGIFKYNLKITRDLASISDNLIEELF